MKEKQQVMDKNQKKELDILMLKFYETLQKKDFGFDDLGRPHSIHGDKDSYDRITDFLLQNGPQKLYRYRPGHDWDIESLRNDTISLSTLKEFNDPFELRKTIDFESVGNDYCQNYPEETGKVLDMNHNSKTRPDYYLKQVEKFKECGNNLQEDLSMKKLRVFVACFSEIKSSLLMWAHYADSHRGICIGYNFIDLVDRFGPNIIPITYSKEYFAICSYEEYIHYLEHVDEAQCCPVRESAQLWADYVRMLRDLDCDLTDKHLIFPNSLKREHDKAARKITQVKDEKLNAIFCERAAKNDKYAWENEEFKVLIPHDISELYEEGRKLSHCVGTYGKVVAEGRSVVAFIRRAADVDTPLCTIEIRQNAIVQARGMSNRPAENIPKMKAFIKAWAANKGLQYAA